MNKIYNALNVLGYADFTSQSLVASQKGICLITNTDNCQTNCAQGCEKGCNSSCQPGCSLSSQNS